MFRSKTISHFLSNISICSQHGLQVFHFSLSISCAIYWIKLLVFLSTLVEGFREKIIADRSNKKQAIKLLPLIAKYSFDTLLGKDLQGILTDSCITIMVVLKDNIFKFHPVTLAIVPLHCKRNRIFVEILSSHFFL